MFAWEKWADTTWQGIWKVLPGWQGSLTLLYTKEEYAGTVAQARSSALRKSDNSVESDPILHVSYDKSVPKRGLSAPLESLKLWLFAWKLSQEFIIISACSCRFILSFSHSVPSSFLTHWCIMELMTNLGDITELFAEYSTEKGFHMILRKEQQLQGSLNLAKRKNYICFHCVLCQ